MPDGEIFFILNKNKKEKEKKKQSKRLARADLSFYV
jgi:hypothetical protein